MFMSMEKQAIRERLEDDERKILSPFAQLSSASKGRARPEPPDAMRPAYQLDRDRIIHCKAFRRLAGKTQVFVFPADHQRTRLTHALEVAIRCTRLILMREGRIVADGLAPPPA